ncbi:MAG: hypothetical protein KJP01_01550 [Gramella sp.]|nr:hypothetical protein [Christiangramia sp.]
MKLTYLILAFFAFSNVNAQEYWDRKDFEISNRSIENTWKDFSFSWQQQSNFSLPDGAFLHLNNQFQKKEIDMLAVIDKTNRTRVQREVNLGSPLPQQKPKEKKLFEITGDLKVRDPNDTFLNPYSPSPFMNPYYRPFNTRRYSPYRYNY